MRRPAVDPRRSARSESRSFARRSKFVQDRHKHVWLSVTLVSEMSANTVAAKRTWLVDWNSPPLSWCVNSIGRQNKAVTTTLCFHEHATRHDDIASPSRIANTSTSTKAPPQAQTAGWVSKQKSNLAHVKEQGLASSVSFGCSFLPPHSVHLPWL